MRRLAYIFIGMLLAALFLGAAVFVYLRFDSITHPSPVTTARQTIPGSVKVKQTHRGSLAATNNPVILAAGDIANCKSSGDIATATLINKLPGTVLTLGDNTYPSGSPSQFATCYAPSWGSFKGRTRPAPGNHDYITKMAAGYYAYFGAAAGDPKKGYYSFDLGTWHMISLNSDCIFIGGCGPGSPEETWLKADLAAHPAKCTLAYWHHPLYSSGIEGSNTRMSTIFADLYNAGADVVLNGHDHDYERFAPQDPYGDYDPLRGITEFVVGTGGASHEPFRVTILPNSLVRNNTSYGVLRMVLRPGGYDWQFMPAGGSSFTDAGSGTCH